MRSSSGSRACIGTNRNFRTFPKCGTLPIERYRAALMSAVGQTRPRHYVPVPANVRYASNSDHSMHESELTRSVESRCGAVALGRTYLLPPLSSDGALMVPPWLRFHIPLIEPDRQISRIRLSDKTSRLHFRVQRHLQFLNTHRSL